jgi:hypothetical protein
LLVKYENSKKIIILLAVDLAIIFLFMFIFPFIFVGAQMPDNRFYIIYQSVLAAVLLYNIGIFARICRRKE